MLSVCKWAAAISAVVLFLALLGIAYYSSPPSDNPTEQQATTEQKPHKQNQEQRIPGTIWQFLFPDSISVFTLVLAIATVGLWIIAIIQFGFLNRQERIAADAANAAKQGAKATQDSVKLAEDTAQRQLRAYVTVKHIEETGTIDPAGNPIGWTLTVEWQNTGSTPTRELEVWITYKLFEPDIPPGFDFARPESVKPVATGVIGPNSTIRTGGHFVPFEIIEKAQAKTGKLYMWGRIDYDDVFQHTPRHHTDFRTEVTVIQNPHIMIPGSTPLGFNVLNATDD